MVAAAREQAVAGVLRTGGQEAWNLSATSAQGVGQRETECLGAMPCASVFLPVQWGQALPSWAQGPDILS